MGVLLKSQLSYKLHYFSFHVLLCFVFWCRTSANSFTHLPLKYSYIGQALVPLECTCGFPNYCINITQVLHHHGNIKWSMSSSIFAENPDLIGQSPFSDEKNIIHSYFSVPLQSVREEYSFP